MILDDDFEAKVEAHLASTPDNRPRYTTARLRAEVTAAKKAARIYALEEAAKVAEEEAAGRDMQRAQANAQNDKRAARDFETMKIEAVHIAHAIRQLMKETA